MNAPDIQTRRALSETYLKLKTEKFALKFQKSEKPSDVIKRCDLKERCELTPPFAQFLLNPEMIGYLPGSNVSPPITHI